MTGPCRSFSLVPNHTWRNEMSTRGNETRNKIATSKNDMCFYSSNWNVRFSLRTRSAPRTHSTTLVATSPWNNLIIGCPCIYLKVELVGCSICRFNTSVNTCHSNVLLQLITYVNSKVRQIRTNFAFRDGGVNKHRCF